MTPTRHTAPRPHIVELIDELPANATGLDRATLHVWRVWARWVRPTVWTLLALLAAAIAAGVACVAVHAVIAGSWGLETVLRSGGRTLRYQPDALWLVDALAVTGDAGWSTTTLRSANPTLAVGKAQVLAIGLRVLFTALVLLPVPWLLRRTTRPLGVGVLVGLLFALVFDGPAGRLGGIPNPGVGAIVNGAIVLAVLLVPIGTVLLGWREARRGSLDGGAPIGLRRGAGSP